MTIKMKYFELCNIIWKSPDTPIQNRADLILDSVEDKIIYTQLQRQFMKKKLQTTFLKSFAMKMSQVKRRKDLFQSKFSDFLATEFDFDPEETITVIESKRPLSYETVDVVEPLDTPSKKLVGRPMIDSTENASESTIWRRATELAEKYSLKVLTLAVKLKEKNYPTLFGRDNEESEDQENVLDGNDILAMYMDLDLTYRKFEFLRFHQERLIGNKTFPPYSKVYKAKNACYPESIEISFFGAQINIIRLVENTIIRILETLDKTQIQGLKNDKLKLIGKWGMDGASGQQTTRQKWESNFINDTEDAEISELAEDLFDTDAIPTELSDSSVFLVTFSPIQLQGGNKVIWQNPKPNSTFYCRPVEFKFARESDKIVQEIFTYYDEQLSKVKTYCFEWEGLRIEASFDIKPTMIDGKIHNILSKNKASNSCNLCLVGPKMINNISHVTKLKCRSEYYKFGFASLHCWINTMQYMLNVAYSIGSDKSKMYKLDETKKKMILIITKPKRLKLTKEQKMDIRNKEIERKNERKTTIQRELKQQLSLTVDVVQQGSGTTNTGNVARKFFSNAETVSKITGVDEEIISRLYAILQAITCGQKIDCHIFKSYALETAMKCVNLYPWYKMPPTVHKYLIHGSDIIKEISHPIGWFSEEPQEASHKIFRKARLHYSRMYQRDKTNEDILHYLLLSSDPLLAKLRVQRDKESRDLTEEAKKLLIEIR